MNVLHLSLRLKSRTSDFLWNIGKLLPDYMCHIPEYSALQGMVLLEPEGVLTKLICINQDNNHKSYNWSGVQDCNGI
jgi:hypothetical protein